MLVLLLSVFFQSYVAQTHIHGHPGAHISAAAASISAETPQNPLAPDDDANCLLCQAVFQAGAFSVPAVPAVVLPVLLFIGLAVFSSPRLAPVLLVSHRWQSRAPPRS